ncbi:MAG: hypothetical protein MPJ50_06565, partial [Pirellulales bacterium]|nr:hypothetical protein [Pirellulales bacterium]
QTHASATTPAPGLGEGPADVNLLTYLRAFENVAGQADASYNRLLYGSFANPLPSELQGAEGRYGELHRGVLSAFDLPAPGVNNVHDPYSAVVNHDYRNWRRRFGSPPDMRAINRLGVGVDGNMLHSSFSRLSPASFLGIPLDRDVQKDNPYEFNGSVTRKLFDGAGGLYYEDRPFTAAELEMLLRFRDADVSQVVNTPTVSNPTGLENRLLELMQLSLDPNTLNGRRVQGQLTTHSADSSAPNIRWTQDMLEAARTAQYLQDLIDAAPSPSIVDLLRFRIAQANGPGVDADQLTNASLVAGYGYLLAPDLLSGTRMDLNRPFGNNRDEVIGNSANGVIDEGHNLNMGAGPPPSPIPSAEPEITGEANTDGLVQTVYDLASEGADLIAAGLPGEAAKYSQFLNLQLTDANYDGVLGNRSHLARHDYARQLFCLMMVLKDPHFRFTDGSGLEPSDGAALPMIPNPTTRPPNYPTYLPEYTVQRLAQFCANSVDYLDRDSIMTAFEYDADPFTDNDGDGITWDVDGDIATQEPVETRRVVWGLEKPAMVLSETWAFHDNRTRDTEDEGGPGNGEFVQPLGADVDFDQTRMPQGSLFIELYCTVSGIVPAELRPQLGVPWRNTQRTPENVVDLSRLAPAPAVPDDPTTTTIDERAPHPVWRLIIGDRNQLISDSIDTNPVGSQRPTFDADLNALIQRGSSVQPLPSPAASDISRVVWLTSRDAYEAVTATLPTGPLRPEDAQDHVYYSDLQWANRPPANQVDLGNQLNWDFTDADTLEAEMRMFHVAPQQYAVIGPRVRTKIGHSWPDPATPDKTFETVIQLLDPRNPLTTPALQDALGFGRAKAPDIIFNDADSTTYVSPPWAANRVVRRPVGIVINGPRIDDGDGRARGRGLSISEPPPPALDVGNPSTVATYYNQPNSNPGPRTLDNFDEYTDPFDVPLDMPSEGGVSALLLQTDIYQDWQDESLFLQRLANPLVPYHPIYNPYITLDMMQLDLSVYNGEEDLAHPRQDPPRIAVSRQKTGELLIDGSLVPQQSHWGPVTAADYLGVSDARDNRVVLHSLGHVNGLYDGVGLNTSVVNDHFLTTGNSVVNEALSTDAVFGPSLAEHIALALAAETNPIADERIGDLQPFYLNILALAQEQTLSTFPTGPGGIFVGAAVGPNQERSPAFTWNNRPFISALDLLNVPGSPPDRLMRDFSVRGMTGTRYGDQLLNIAPFRHLFPFFQEFDPNPSAGLPTPPRSNFHHLFEYVHVPSRFPESQKVLTPAVSGTPVNFESLPLHPPFNKLSQFREPGKINLNNMQDTGEGFAAATNDEIDPAISDLAYNSVNAFRAMRQSRKGFGAIPGPAAPPEMDLEFNPAEPSFFARPFKGYSESDIDETYLRREPGGQQPLLAARTVTDPSPTGVKLGSNPVPPERDGDRHAYLRHEPFNKLGNIMTTRSNVYAVWITVGFFEVTPAPAAGGLSPSRELYPDGLMLGHELGLTDGSIVRHRMFGIIDRSRPTAFVRGFDYNAKETVLLKRIIE